METRSVAVEPSSTISVPVPVRPVVARCRTSPRVPLVSTMMFSRRLVPNTCRVSVPALSVTWTRAPGAELDAHQVVALQRGERDVADEPFTLRAAEPTVSAPSASPTRNTLVTASPLRTAFSKIPSRFSTTAPGAKSVPTTVPTTNRSS